MSPAGGLPKSDASAAARETAAADAGDAEAREALDKFAARFEKKAAGEEQPLKKKSKPKKKKKTKNKRHSMGEYKCAKCGKRVTRKVKLGCPRCRAAFYCGEACFRGDWRRHRREECHAVQNWEAQHSAWLLRQTSKTATDGDEGGEGGGGGAGN